MGASEMGRTIAVAVDTSRESELAFQLALQELKADDCLLLVYARPLRHGDAHYNFVTKSIQRAIDAQARDVMQKYSALAAIAKVRFEALEVEAPHREEAVAAKCQEAGADILFQAAPAAKSQHLLKGSSLSNDLCASCNPFLRGDGRLIRSAPCRYKSGAVEYPCPVINVGTGQSAPTSGGLWPSSGARSEYKLLSNGKTIPS